MQEEQHHPESSHPKPRGRKARWLMPVVVLAAMAVAFGGGLLLANNFASKPTVPESIRSQMSFEPHVPGKLPDNYELVPDSYTINEGVLVYRAEKGDARIAFTEQSKPKDFDFGDFYKKQLQDSRSLEGTRYPSVWGKTQDGDVILSVVTDDTWIIVNSAMPLGEEDLERIAESL